MQINKEEFNELGQARSCSNLWTLLAPMILDSAPIVRNIQFEIFRPTEPDDAHLRDFDSFEPDVHGEQS